MRAHVDAVDPVLAARRDVEAAEDVHQRALAAAGAAHDRDEVAALDAERDAAQGATCTAPVSKTFVAARRVDHAPRAPLQLRARDERRWRLRAESARTAQRRVAVPVGSTSPSSASQAAEAAAPPQPPPPSPTQRCRRFRACRCRWSPVEVAMRVLIGIATSSPGFSPATICVRRAADEAGDHGRHRHLAVARRRLPSSRAARADRGALDA